MNSDIQNEAIGQWIRSVRDETGLSQIQFAEKIKYSHKHLCQVENGRARCSMEMINRINDVFGVYINQETLEQNAEKEQILLGLDGIISQLIDIRSRL